MSKTDKTKPWLVRVAEHRPWADHDHRNGICNLPADPRTPKNYSDPYACRWSDWNMGYIGRCCSGCGCRLCSDYDGRKAERRSRRHQARRETRQLIKETRQPQQ